MGAIIDRELGTALLRSALRTARQDYAFAARVGYPDMAVSGLTMSMGICIPLEIVCDPIEYKGAVNEIKYLRRRARGSKQ